MTDRERCGHCFRRNNVDRMFYYPATSEFPEGRWLCLRGCADRVKMLEASRHQHVQSQERIELLLKEFDISG